MRFFNLLIGALLSTVLFYSCANLELTNALVSGNIENFKGDSIYFNYHNYDYLEGTQTIPVVVSKDGDFALEVPLIDYKEYRIQLSKKGLISNYILKPGWNSIIHIRMSDAELVDTVYFREDGAIENTLRQELNSQFWTGFSFMSIPPGQFQSKIDSLDALMNSMLDAKLNNGITADGQVMEILKQEIKYCRVQKWMNYERKYSRLKPDSVMEIIYSKTRPVYNSIEFDNPLLVNSTFYKSIIEDIIRKEVAKKVNYQVLKKFHEDDMNALQKAFADARFSEGLNVIDSIIINPVVKENVYYHLFLRNMQIQTVESLKDKYSQFADVVTNPEKQTYIKQRISQLESLTPGNPAPIFTYVNIDEQAISLEDLKGKYVYMDIWATWCGPCIAESPYFKTLAEKYGDKIAFVGISVDPDKEKWRNYVMEKELPGIQVYAGKNFESDIIKKYSIQGIPRFIMVDPDGNIIDINAPRPSHDGTEKILQNWLKDEANNSI